MDSFGFDSCSGLFYIRIHEPIRLVHEMDGLKVSHEVFHAYIYIHGFEQDGRWHPTLGY